jgi:16S rRNA (uracil1498-N3)-methyltransferase
MPRVSEATPASSAFFLADDASPLAPRLRAEDAEHAVRVLRLGPGDRLVGLDGRGGRLPLRVRGVERGRLDLEVAGTRQLTPEPGAEGSPLPWFELAIAWPRRNRVEDMVGRLVQLGAAAIRPLEARRRGPEAPPRDPPERLLRVVREACKQSGRAWLTTFEPCLTPAALVAARPTSPLAVLDPRGGFALDTWLRSLRPSPLGTGTRSRPIVLVIGPEGGLSPAELEALEARGASRVWIGPHILRVETAAEAAMAIAGIVHGKTGSGREQSALPQGDEVAVPHDHVVEQGNAEHRPGLA